MEKKDEVKKVDGCNGWLGWNLVVIKKNNYGLRMKICLKLLLN